MAPGYRSEEAIEKEEVDAEVGVHEAFAVQTFVMGVVQPARFQKPGPQTRDSGHPTFFALQSPIEISGNFVR
jgi:hypothetical protein